MLERIANVLDQMDALYVVCRFPFNGFDDLISLERNRVLEMYHDMIREHDGVVDRDLFFFVVFYIESQVELFDMSLSSYKITVNNPGLQFNNQTEKTSGLSASNIYKTTTVISQTKIKKASTKKS